MTPLLAQRLAGAGLDWIVPDWTAPTTVHAMSTTRNGGAATGARATLDLGGATPAQDVHLDAVLENRRRLAAFLPAAPIWLSQVHGADVVAIDKGNVAALTSLPPYADAAVTRAPGIVLGVRTADCLPVLFADRAGAVVGAAHAGWRGLSNGVLEATLRAMHVPPDDIVTWLGPAIGPQKFEVGADVYAAFCSADADAARSFAPLRDGKWLGDLYALARLRLQRAGVTDIKGGDFCTLSEPGRFFSYRGNKDTGRMATLVWLA
ncbi:MAG: peptidoglycan editing factor PgeF [Betaproteobacteria bacterium]